MIAGNSGTRGWPLISLGIVLGGWVLLRAVLWETPFAPSIIAVGDEETRLEELAPGRPSAVAAPIPATVDDAAPAPLPYPPVYEPLERPGFEMPPLQDRSARSAAGRAGLRVADRIIAHSMPLPLHTGAMGRVSVRVSPATASTARRRSDRPGCDLCARSGEGIYPSGLRKPLGNGYLGTLARGYDHGADFRAAQAMAAARPAQSCAIASIRPAPTLRNCTFAPPAHWRASAKPMWRLAHRRGRSPRCPCASRQKHG